MEGKRLIGRQPGRKDFPVRVGKEGGTGGGGTVYARGQGRKEVLKIYHGGQAADYEGKISAMLRRGPPDGLSKGTLIAWPSYEVRDSSGRFLGFGMPAIDFRESRDLLDWKTKATRNRANLSHDVRKRLLLVRNLATVLRTLHATQIHIVDLKPANLRATVDGGKICLIDCDGWALPGFDVAQFTPNYTAPGFVDDLRRGCPKDSRLAEQDGFALAVIVYELLLGRHPCQDSEGRGGTALPSSIDERVQRWMFGCVRPLQAGVGLPGNSLFHHIPDDLQGLFSRTFERGGRSRPTPKEWVDVLDSRLKPILRDPAPLCDVDVGHLKLDGDCAHCERGPLRLAPARAPKRPAASLPSKRPRAAAPMGQGAGRRRRHKRLFFMAWLILLLGLWFSIRSSYEQSIRSSYEQRIGPNAPRPEHATRPGDTPIETTTSPDGRRFGAVVLENGRASSRPGHLGVADARIVVHGPVPRTLHIGYKPTGGTWKQVVKKKPNEWAFRTQDDSTWWYTVTLEIPRPGPCELLIVAEYFDGESMDHHERLQFGAK